MRVMTYYSETLKNHQAWTALLVLCEYKHFIKERLDSLYVVWNSVQWILSRVVLTQY